MIHHHTCCAQHIARLLISVIAILGLFRSSGQVPLDSLWNVFEDTSIDDSVRMHALHTIAWDGYLFSQPDSAFYYASELYDLAKDVGSDKGVAGALNIQGISSSMQGRNSEAVSYFLTGLRIYESMEMPDGSTGDLERMASMLGNIANVYRAQGDHEKALDNTEKILGLFEEMELRGVQPRRASIASHMHNVGLDLAELGHYDRALSYYRKSLELKRLDGDEKAIAASLHSIGSMYAKWAESAPVDGMNVPAQKYLDSALIFYRSSLELAERSGQLEGTVIVLNNIGAIHQKRQNYSAAIEASEKAMSIAQEAGLTLEIQHSAENLYEYYEVTGDHKKALDMYQLYVQMRDSVAGIDSQREVLRQEYAYKIRQKALTDSLNHQNELALTNAMNDAKLQKRNMVLVGGLSLALLGVLLFRVRQQRRGRERELKAERDRIHRLQRIDQLKDQFLANTSHELLTPLNGMIGLSEGMLDKAENAEAKRDLAMVVSSGKRLASLVNELLDMARIKHGDIHLDIRPVDVRSIADVVVQVCAQLVRGKNLELLNRIDQGVELIAADEDRITQVLFNLVGNAIKFTEEGTIEISAKANGPMLEIAVKDTGIGIPSDKLDSIFNEFEQADGSDTRQFAGTGLGLSISKVLVEKHGGAMWVETKVGEGSVFRFTIPISDAVAHRHVASADEKKVLSSLHEFNEQVTDVSVDAGSVQAGSSELIRILIVDDEPINHQVLINHLDSELYVTSSAMSGKEALRTLEDDERFDLVLLDVMMPGMSGYEVCTRIRQKYAASELPVILITAKNQVQDLVQGLNVGANDYMAKPFSKDEFLARLGTHLNLHRINKATQRFVPSEFIKSLGKDSITDVHHGDNISAQVTVFFSDIRGYTGLAESMEPSDNFGFVSGYARRMGPVIRGHNGFVNQFLGDGIMALFQHSAVDSLNAAVDMQDSIRKYNLERVGRERQPIVVGMGMHTGPLVMGIIGDEKRTEPAIISDTVNFAARVEGLTKHYKTNILLSRSTYELLDETNKARCRYLGLVQVKGKKKAMGLYEAIDGLPERERGPRSSTKECFESGVEHFVKGEFEEAMVAFEQVLNTDPNDRTAQVVMRKTQELLQSGPLENWKGVAEFTTK